jgi:uncharacterized protein YkwD
VHHRPAGPPLTARVLGASTRRGLPLRVLLRVRVGRLVLAGVVTTAVTAVMVGLPVVSGLGSDDTRPLALDSSSSTTTSPSTEDASPVVMGVDGRPIASSSFAGAAPSGETAEAAPETTPAPAAAPEAPETVAAPTAPVSPSTVAPSDPPSAAPSLPGSSGPAAPVRPAPAPADPPAPVPPVPPEEPAEVDAEGELLALLDEARAGCAPLTADGALTAAARAHSAVMRDVGALSPLEGGPAGSIAQGGTQAGDVLAGWLADPTGRATILDCSRGSVGIGLVEGTDGPWWTLLLA